MLQPDKEVSRREAGGVYPALISALG